jgi:hypothetical protein
MTLRLILFVFFTVSLLINSAGATPPPDPNSPESIVFKLYRDYAWEAIMAGSFSDALFEQPKNVLEQYFDEKLTTLILKNRACEEKNGMCNLDFDPIWDSQDPSAGDLEVQKTDKQNIISVKFRYPSSDVKIELKYQVTKTAEDWRISDISGRDWSLVSILSRPEPE